MQAKSKKISVTYHCLVLRSAYRVLRIAYCVSRTAYHNIALKTIHFAHFIRSVAATPRHLSVVHRASIR